MFKVFKHLQVLFFICFIFLSPLLHAEYTNYEDSYKIKSHSSKHHNLTYDAKKFEFTKKSKTTPSVDLRYKAFFFETLHVDDLLPKALLSRSKQLRKIYKDLTFKNILFVSLQAPSEVHSSRTYGQSYSVTLEKDDIPKDILKQLPRWKDMKVTATIDTDGTTYGGSFRGYFDESQNSGFNTIFKKIGVRPEPFVISGGSKKYDPFLVVQSGKVQKMKYGEKIEEKGQDAQKKYIKSLGIILDIPKLKLPLVDRYVKLENIAIAIKSGLYELEPWKSLPEAFKAKKEKSDMDIYLSAESTIQIRDYKHKGAVLLDLAQSEEQDSFTMISFNKDEDIFSNLKLHKLSFLKKAKVSSAAAYKIKIDQNKKDESKSKLSLTAVGEVDISGREIDLTAMFEYNHNGLYLDYVDLHDNLTLADFSHGIPKADEFALSEIKIYPPFNPDIEPGIEAKTKFFDIENDLFLFEHDGSDVLAVDISAKDNASFNLAHLMGKAKKGIIPKTVNDNLKGFTVANGAVIFSDKEMNIDFSNLKKGVAKDLFVSIFGKRTTPMKLYKTTFVSDFDAKIAGKLGGLIKNGKNGVNFGLNDNTYILGSVEGIFGKEPFYLDLEFIGDQAYDISSLNLPASFKKLKTSTKEGVFLKVMDGTAEVAAETGFGFTVNNSTIEFDGSLGANINEESVGLSLTGKSDDNINNFAGVKNFKVTEAKINVVIGNDITGGLEVDTSFMGRNMKVSSDLVFDPKGYPKGLGFKTYVSKLDQDGWKLVNYTTVLMAPTLTLGGIGAIGGAGTLGVIGAIAGNPEGDAGGAAAGAPFGGVGAAPGAVVGGLVSSAIVGGAGVAVGGIAAGVTGAAIGAGIGALGDVVLGKTKLGQKGMDKLTKLEAHIFKAENIYLSFATKNAASAELGIPEGVHFNMENIQFFDGDTSDFRPDFSGIYNLAHQITKDVDKTENFLKKMEKDFEHLEKELENKMKAKEDEYKKKYPKNWKEKLFKDTIKTIDFTPVEDKAKHYAKQIHKIFDKVMAVVHHELGLVKEAPKDVEYELTKELKTSINHLKQFMNGAHIKDEKFGPIEIPKAGITLVPSFEAKGEVKLFDEFDETIEIKFNDDNKLMFESDFTIKKLGQIRNRFILQDKKEVEVLGEFPSTKKFETWLENKIKKDASAILKDGTDMFSKLKDDIEKLENNIENIAQEIAKEGKKELTYIENSKEVRYAEKVWKEARRDYNKAVDKCKSYRACVCCGHGCGHPCKSIYEKAKGDIDKIVSAVNGFGKILNIGHIVNPHYKKHAYEDAKKNVDVSTFNAKVAEYKSSKQEKSSELKGLKDEMNSVGEKGFSPFVAKIKNAIQTTSIAEDFSIKELAYAGMLNAKTPRDTLYLMKIEYMLFGKDKVDYVLFKPFDMQFNEASFAYFSINVFEYILKNAAANNKMFSKPLHWVMKNTDRHIKSLQGFMEKHISKTNERKYKKAIESFISNTKGVREMSSEYEERLLEDMQIVSPVDLMAPSKSFKKRYLAVAHSTLCLGVASNGIDVIQKDCKNIKSEQWSAQKILDDTKNPTGYIQLKTNGLCLKAATKENKESGLPLKLSQCNKNDMHEQWKIISKDGIFDMIVNRYSQKCLHFDTVNTNPRTAYAVWRSCLSIDSQGFRDIKDAQRPAWHKVENMIEAKSGSCLATKKSFDEYFQKTKKGHFTATKPIFERMKQRKDDILIADKCEKGVENEFNFLELINGDIKLVHAQTGWCVAPKSKYSHELALKPCNKGDYMFWDPIEVGGAVLLKNKENNKCITLESVQNKALKEASLQNCTKADSQRVDFLK